MNPFHHPTGWDDAKGLETVVSYHANYETGTGKTKKLQKMELWDLCKATTVVASGGAQTAAKAVVEEPAAVEVPLVGAVPQSSLPHSKWIRLLQDVQADCGLKAEAVPIHNGGGFASKFQMVAAKVLKALQKGSAVRLAGHFSGYSAIEPCKRAVGDEVYNHHGSFTCFFETERPCAKDGQGQPGGKAKAALSQFEDLKDAKEKQVLFQAIEAYLFRPNTDTQAEFAKREVEVGVVVPKGGLLLGVHARRGDKINDSYNRYYTAKEYVDAVRAGAAKLTGGDGGTRTCLVYVASDSLTVPTEMKELLSGTTSSGCNFQVVFQSATLTQQATDHHRFDKNAAAMAGKISMMPAGEAKRATLEILFDIHTLGHASLLIGTLTSQIGRLAAGLQRAHGISPKLAIAMDYPNWQMVEGMGAGDGIPSPLGEGWVPAPHDHDTASQLHLANPLVAAIAEVQGDCALHTTEVAIPKGPGEFAEQFRQLCAQVATALRKGQSFWISGHFLGHSDGKLCKEALGESAFKAGSFQCFFEEERSCSAGRAQEAAEGSAQALARASPTHLLQAVETYLFRLSEGMMAEVLKRKWWVRLDSGEEGHFVVAVDAEPRPGRGSASTWSYSVEEVVNVVYYSLTVASTEERKLQTCVVYVASNTSQVVRDVRAALDKIAKTLPCKISAIGMQDWWDSHPNLKKQIRQREVVDVLFDVFLLSRADVVVGSLKSHLGQLAVGLRAVLNGTRARRKGAAVAIAYSAKVAKASEAGLPSPRDEGWSDPFS